MAATDRSRDGRTVVGHRTGRWNGRTKIPGDCTKTGRENRDGDGSQDATNLDARYRQLKSFLVLPTFFSLFSRESLRSAPSPPKKSVRSSVERPPNWTDFP